MTALSPESLQRLDVLNMVSNSIAQAIVEDFFIFDLFPKAMKYGTEISVELIKSKPIEQIGQAMSDYGSMTQKIGRGIQYTGKGVYPWKDLL